MLETSGGCSEKAVLALYKATWAEINRLRTYEWKIAYYFAGLSVGLIALLTNASVKPLLTCQLRWCLTGIQVVAAFLGVLYLEMTHRYLSQQRNIRRQVEEVLGFYDPGRLGPSSLLPATWKGRRITSSFQRIGLLVPLMIMVLAVQGFTVYLIWQIR